ncbi:MULTISPECIES: hypothetical protein [Gracilibacillus]|nr:MULTISPECIES: hypothetical protein [Gracilibacillus]
MFGLLESDIREINNTLQSFSEIEHGIIFGNRAMVNYKRGSE